MLLGNYAVINKSPGRFFAGTSLSGNRSNFNTSGSQRGVFFITSLITQNYYSSVPIGYGPGAAWLIAQKAGNIAAINGTIGTGTLSNANLAGGLNGVVNITDASGTVVASINARALMNSALSGSGTLSADIIGILVLGAVLTGSSTITAALGALSGALTNLTGSGDITSAAVSALAYPTSNLSGVGTINATISALGNIVSGLVGSGIFTANGTGALYATADLVGSATLIADLTALAALTADLAGSSSIIASVVGEEYMFVDISCLATLSADITAVVGILSDLDGSGTVNADILGTMAGASNLAGSAALNASITALGNTLANLIGVGTITSANTTAFADIAAGISVASSDPLSPENLAAAVWNSLAASYNNPATMGEIMNNVGAGADPWNTTLPGSYPDGSAGAVLGNLLANVPSAVWDEIKSGHITPDTYGKIVQDCETLVKQIKALTAAQL